MIPEKKQEKKQTRAPETVLLYYIELIKRRIYAQWTIPATAAGQQASDIVTIKIQITRDGSLKTLQFIQESDNPLLNRSISDAITNSKPFPPFPSDLQEQSLDITINFDTKQ